MLSNEMLVEIAREACQHATPTAELASKLAQRFRRKYKLKVDLNTLAQHLDHSREIYRFAAQTLKASLLPSDDGFTSLKHVNDQKFMGTIQAHFATDDSAVLHEIAHWVIQYEYLR